MTRERPAPRKPRGAYAKTEAKRIAILDAALEVFAQSGYRSGSLREVAERVGMSEAGLLHHFPNKVALLEGTLDRRDALASRIINTHHPDGGVVLAGNIRLARHNATIPGVVELFCTLSAEATSPDHPAHDYFVARYVTTRDLIRESFQKLEGRGRLRPGVDPARAAASAVAVWDGLQLQWLLERTSVDVGTGLREYFDGVAEIDWDEVIPIAEAWNGEGGE